MNGAMPMGWLVHGQGLERNRKNAAALQTTRLAAAYAGYDGGAGLARCDPGGTAGTVVPIGVGSVA